MIWTTAIGKELKNTLMYSTSFDLEKNLFNLFRHIVPYIKSSETSKQIDRAGIDFFVPSDDLNSSTKFTFELSIQCKGFEKGVFNASHYPQCRSSVESFVNSSYSSKIYFLVINQVIKSQYREKLKLLMDLIVESKKVEKAVFFDIYELLKYIESKFSIQIENDILRLSQKYYDDYIKVMSMDLYYPNVPFFIRYKSDINPLEHLVNRSKVDLNSGRYPADYVKSKYFFIISEFGFGKTRLMLELFRHYKNSSCFPLFFPIIAFEDQDFVNSTDLCKRIIELIVEHREIDLSQNILYHRLASRILVTTLRNNPQIVLMFDGLDEHRYLNKSFGIKSFFNITSEFKAVCIFAMRKSFWDDRSGNISIAVGKNRRIQDKILLTEWSNSNIAEYIDKIIGRVDISETNRSALLIFKEIVEHDEYYNYYGDIPKRPLFLDIIISDLLENGLQKKNLYQLYDSYFEKKFIRDIYGSFEKIFTKRELPIKGDVVKQCNTIMKILEIIAFKMMDGLGDGIIEMRETIKESEIESLITTYGIFDVLSLLLHSVLVTVSGRKDNNLTLKFAHRSYQEFFLAGHIRREFHNGNRDVIRSRIIGENVVLFLADIQEICKWAKQDSLKFEKDSIGFQLLEYINPQ